MKILFCMFQPGFVRHFRRTIGLLCEQGHTVHIAFHSEKVSAAEWTAEVRDGRPGVTFSVDAPRRKDSWSQLAMRMRAMRDYGMYFDRRYAHADQMKANAARELAETDRVLVDRAARIPGGRRLLDALLNLAELAIPTDPRIDAFLDGEAPDLVLLTPLVMFNSPQVDIVKSARIRGTPSALCVASWDNLSNKGMMRELPDRVMVWNEAQAEEAATLHRMPRDRIVVTGAQSFDHWFDARPSRSREDFLAERGLRPDSDLILYMCSATSISPREVELVRIWRDALRAAADPRIAQAALLVRPHPWNPQPWEEMDDLRQDNLAVWPRDARNPFDPQERRDYFDSIHHASAVVGLNTSGQIEAGLMGKPVLTILSEDIPATVRGTADTVHFQHLLQFNGGLLHVARSFEEHIDHLSRAMSGDDGMLDRSRRFTEGFIRPKGLDQPASPLLAEAILALAEVTPRRRVLFDALVAPWLRRLMKRIAPASGTERQPEDLDHDGAGLRS